MNKVFSKKKFAVACSSGIAALTLLCVGICALVPSSSVTVSASTEETEDCLKVFIGDVDHAPENYVQQRAAYLEDIADVNTSTTMDAVIGLNDYYTVETVADWAKEYDVNIDRAYMWPKGETGRLILCVDNGDIESSLKRYMQQVEEGDYCDDPQFAADYQRLLDGEYEVFALTVNATADELEALSAEADCISYVDVMQNEEAETYASKKGKTVSYIELPSKPDGAL